MSGEGIRQIANYRGGRVGTLEGLQCILTWGLVASRALDLVNPNPKP